MVCPRHRLGSKRTVNKGSKNSKHMPAVGLEPTRPREQQILSLPCMPFHHAGAYIFVFTMECRRKSREVFNLRIKVFQRTINI